MKKILSILVLFSILSACNNSNISNDFQNLDNNINSLSNQSKSIEEIKDKPAFKVNGTYYGASNVDDNGTVEIRKLSNNSWEKLGRLDDAKLVNLLGKYNESQFKVGSKIMLTKNTEWEVKSFDKRTKLVVFMIDSGNSIIIKKYPAALANILIAKNK